MSQTEAITPTGEIVVKSPRLYDDDTLRSVKTFADAAALAEQSIGGVSTMADYGNGFAVLPSDEKSRLVKVPLVILEWTFHDGDKGTFVSALVVTKSGERLILNDGSTGIRDQLKRVTDVRSKNGATPEQGSLLVPGGLRQSDYTNRDGIDGTTFYLSE